MNFEALELKEIKVGEFKIFNKLCGIAYVKHKISENNFENIYVVYCNHEKFFGNLGKPFGVGKTPEEAMVNEDIAFHEKKAYECIL